MKVLDVFTRIGQCVATLGFLLVVIAIVRTISEHSALFGIGALGIGIGLTIALFVLIFS